MMCNTLLVPSILDMYSDTWPDSITALLAYTGQPDNNHWHGIPSMACVSSKRIEKEICKDIFLFVGLVYSLPSALEGGVWLNAIINLSENKLLSTGLACIFTVDHTGLWCGEWTLGKSTPSCRRALTGFNNIQVRMLPWGPNALTFRSPPAKEQRSLVAPYSQGNKYL